MAKRTTRYLTRPGFVVDPQSMDLTSGRQIDWANVPESYREGAVVVRVAVVAALAAVSVTVDALPGALPAGAVLRFSADEYATLTAAAAAGATVIATEPLVGALEVGDTATYSVDAGKKRLPAGTAVGDLLGNGKVSPRVAATNPAVGLLVTGASQDDPNAALTGYGVYAGGIVYEALLPDSTGNPRTLDAAIKTELRNAGGAWVFEKYQDAR